MSLRVSSSSVIRLLLYLSDLTLLLLLQLYFLFGYIVNHLDNPSFSPNSETDVFSGTLSH